MRARFRSLIAFVWMVPLMLGCPWRSEARVRAGFEFGLNYSSLNYDNLDGIPMIYWDPGWRPSFTGGATLQFPIRGRFDLETGLRYVQQGNRVKFDTRSDPPGILGEFRIYQDYISVPALLAFYPSRRVFVSLGPELGFLVAAHSVIEYESSTFPTNSIDDKDNVESTNVTLDAATGYEFPAGNHVGTVSLRYTHGITGIAKEGRWTTDWETRGIEFLVGMRW